MMKPKKNQTKEKQNKIEMNPNSLIYLQKKARRRERKKTQSFFYYVFIYFAGNQYQNIPFFSFTLGRIGSTSALVSLAQMARKRAIKIKVCQRGWVIW